MRTDRVAKMWSFIGGSWSWLITETVETFETIETAGGKVLQGTCFYNQYAREIGEANGWRRLLSNSAKIVNILGGYGYDPALASMEACVDSAVAGRIVA